MPKGIAVFDLDGTIGDFSPIDFFSLIYSVDDLLNFSGITEKEKRLLNDNYQKYTSETKEFLNALKTTFEQELDTAGYTSMILRPHIKDIISKLLEEKDKKTLAGCIIYSNNGNPYNLEFAGRALERAFNRNDIFLAYIDRSHPIRDEFDGPSTGARKKTLATIQKVAKRYAYINDLQASDVIFFDDLLHEDLKEKKVNYINVNGFHTSIKNDQLKEIFNLFEGVLYDLFAKYKNMGATFFDLYHIQHYAKVYSIEDMEARYISYSKLNYYGPFISDYLKIKDNLDRYTESIQKYAIKSGGNRVKRRRTKKYKSIKKNRTRV